MALSIFVFLSSGLMGCFVGMGVCAAIWGENILRTALGNPPDHFHPAFWTFMFIMVPSMIIGFAGGIPLCQLLQAYAKWQKGERSKPDFLVWLKNLAKEP